MKTLLLVFGLFGGLFGNAVDENRILEQDCDVVLTAEQEELKVYAESLLEGYDLESMDRVELAGVKAEINLLIQEKAIELGVELPMNSEHAYGSGMNGQYEGRTAQGARGSHGRMSQGTYGTGDGTCDYEVTDEAVIA